MGEVLPPLISDFKGSHWLDPSVALFSLYTKLNVMIKPKQFLTSAKKGSSYSEEVYY